MTKYIGNILVLIGFLFLFVSWLQGPVIFLAGDSTMANKPAEAFPEFGWGQVLPEYFNSAVKIDNHAMNGRSTRSFIYEGRWDSLINLVRKGDYVVVQFGHNDGSVEKVARYATPEEYRYNLNKFVREIREKGANPIICTPVQRRKFDSLGVFVDTHGEYPSIARQLAQMLDVPLIDMQQKSQELIVNAGVEGSKELFLHCKPGEYTRFPEGKEDNTHFSEYGARLMAGLFVEGLKEINSPLVQYLKLDEK